MKLSEFKLLGGKPASDYGGKLTLLRSTDGGKQWQSEYEEEY
jgi:photosystem II stability/assembly factor-like uncharacterized protein